MLIDSEHSAQKILLDENTINFLNQECDRFINLYSQAQANAQSVFNFYLTFVTTVVGGIVLILQSDARDIDSILALLLLFSALVGSVYLSALSGRYAHAGRFAHAVDEIRRYLIAHLNLPMPQIYGTFVVEDTPVEDPDNAPRYIWLFPTGTYQMFIAIVNSAALTGMVLLIFTSAGADSIRTVLATIIIFVLTMTIYNVYSHLIIYRINRSLHVRIDVSGTLRLWAARE